MEYLKQLIKLAGALIACGSTALFANGPTGINLAGLADWSEEIKFTDAFKQSREWTYHEITPGAEWSIDRTIPLNENGWPIETPWNDGDNPPIIPRVLMLWGLEGGYPSGDFRLIVKGSGQVRLWGDARGTYNTPVDTIVTVENPSTGVVIELEQSLAEDPIHDIKFILPDYVDTYETEIFHKELISFLEPFQNIRYMDWLSTNFSDVVTWDDRTPPEYYTQAKRTGASWELLIELTNTTMKDPWICIPHLADDDYIRNLAELLKENIHPDLKIYIEYSNELWNGSFEQNREVAELAEARGYTGERWELAWQYTAARSAEMFDIFEDVFDNDNRLIKVLPTQAANDWVTGRIIEHMNDTKYNPSGVKADAIAIAPYFGGAVANAIADSGLVESISVDEILDRADSSLSRSFQWMDEHKALADSLGMIVIGYEGGQHLVGVGEAQNDTTLAMKLIAANRHPRMGDLYCKYLDYWYHEAQLDLFAIFSSHGTPSKYGSWGIKEYYADVDNSKYQAVLECAIPENLQSSSSGTSSSSSATSSSSEPLSSSSSEPTQGSSTQLSSSMVSSSSIALSSEEPSSSQDPSISSVTESSSSEISSSSQDLSPIIKHQKKFKVRKLDNSTYQLKYRENNFQFKVYDLVGRSIKYEILDRSEKSLTLRTGEWARFLIINSNNKLIYLPLP